MTTTRTKEHISVAVPERKAISGLVTIQATWHGLSYRQEFINFVVDDEAHPLIVELVVNGKGSAEYVSGGREGFSSERSRVLLAEQYDRSEIGTFIFQVSDLDPDFYKIALDIETQSLKYSFNYGGPNDWSKFKNDRLRDTQKVEWYSEMGVILQELQVSVCTDPIPVSCDSSPDSTMLEVVYGERHVLTCTASGAPFLKADWLHNGREPAVDPIESSVQDRAQYRLKSSIIIESLDKSHLGTWECKITNKNFGDATINFMKKAFHFYPVMLLQAPTAFLIDPIKDSNDFEFLFEGYPLDSVYSEIIPSVGIALSVTIIHKSLPPRKHFHLSVSRAAASEFTFSVLSSETIVFEKVFVTIGSSCKSGTFGVREECRACPYGTTSNPGSVTCNPVDEPCLDGEYGHGHNCQVCPNGTATFGRAAKEQDCLEVPDPQRTCEGGHYGFGETCQRCPDGQTSLNAGAVKRQECVPCTDENRASCVSTRKKTVSRGGTYSHLGVAVSFLLIGMFIGVTILRKAFRMLLKFLYSKFGQCRSFDPLALGYNLVRPDEPRVVTCQPPQQYRPDENEIEEWAARAGVDTDGLRLGWGRD